MELLAKDIASFEDSLGQLLIERGKIDRTGLDRAKRVREGQNEPLHMLLPKLGLVSERDVASALSDPHKPGIDGVGLACPKCSGTLRRTATCCGIYATRNVSRPI